MMSRRSMKYWRCSSASGVKDSLAKTEHRKSSIPGSRSENRNILQNFICAARQFRLLNNVKKQRRR